MDAENEPTRCPVCGAALEWLACVFCAGTGDGGANAVCDRCRGKGGRFVCPQGDAAPASDERDLRERLLGGAT